MDTTISAVDSGTYDHFQPPGCPSLGFTFPCSSTRPNPRHGWRDKGRRQNHLDDKATVLDDVDCIQKWGSDSE